MLELLKSKTILGVIVLVISNLVTKVTHHAVLTAEQQQDVLNTILDLVPQVGQLVGAVMAVYGRVTAKGPLGVPAPLLAIAPLSDPPYSTDSIRKKDDPRPDIIRLAQAVPGIPVAAPPMGSFPDLQPATPEPQKVTGDPVPVVAPLAPSPAMPATKAPAPLFQK